MKSIIAAIILFTMTMSHAIADDARKVVLHVNQPQKVSLLIDTIKYLRENHSDIKIAVVVNGPAVVRMSKQYHYAKELVNNSYWVGACSIAMFNNRLAQSDLTEGVHFISESGIVALINFQEEGYSYIKV